VNAQKRSLRRGKVLVDWVQDPTRSTVAPYSLRAAPWPLVSTPLSWDEVENAVYGGRPERLFITSDSVLERVDRLGDVFAPVLELEQTLPAV
jgi:bifunctional non-homologous end joining protein LigD